MWSSSAGNCWGREMVENWKHSLRRDMYNRDKDVLVLILQGAVETSLRILCTALDTLLKNGDLKWEQAWRRAATMMRDMESLTYNGRLEFGLFSLSERSLRGDMIAACEYIIFTPVKENNYFRTVLTEKQIGWSRDLGRDVKQQGEVQGLQRAEDLGAVSHWSLKKLWLPVWSPCTPTTAAVRENCAAVSVGVIGMWGYHTTPLWISR